MAVDLDKLVVQLSADIKGYERELRRAQGVTNQQTRAIENKFRSMNTNLSNIGKNAARSLIAPLAGVAAALSVREIISYADAWTVAGNKLAAAGSIAGRQARSLEEINEIATRTRSGITNTVDLYAKLLRSTANVAQSEEEVARATEIVNKAFKAGGAAASEQTAGILQLSQALGSGLLQGDELRSIRENAPLLAQAIADEFNTTIGGLKELGATGQLTVDRIFKAILDAQPKIEAAFATTNQTIGDSFNRINNEFTKYIGHTDDSLSATERLASAMNSLADNFEETADVALKFAGVIAAALVGRAIGGMIRSLGLAGTALIRFLTLARGGAGVIAAFGSIGAAAGPIGAVLGVAAAAALYFATSSESAAERTARLKEELRSLGLLSDEASTSVDNLSTSLNKIGSEEQRRHVKDIADELERLRTGTTLTSPFTENIDLDTLGDIAERLRDIRDTYGMGIITGDAEREGANQIQAAITAYTEGTATAEELVAILDEVAAQNLSDPMDDLITATRKLLPYVEGLQLNLRMTADSAVEAAEAIEEAARRQAILRRAGSTTFDPLRIRRAEESSMDAFDPQRQARSIGQSFLEEHAVNEALSQWEQDVRRVTEELMDGAEKIGGAIDYVAARTRAIATVNAKNLADATTGAIDDYVAEVVQAEAPQGGPNLAGASSAYGVGQFIDETWLRLFKQEFPDRAKNMARETMLALRANGEISRQLIEAYAEENAKVLQAAGVSVDKAALHLAHFLGAGDAVKVLQAAPGTPLSGLIDPDSIAANPEVLGGGKTVDDAIIYANNRAQIATAIRDETAARNDMIAAVEAEIEALGLEARSFSQSTFEAEKARVAFDLRQQAIAAGLELTPELIATIDRLSTAYANATVSVEMAAKGTEKFAEAQEIAIEAMDEFRDTAGDVLKGFISDLVSGKSAAEALGNALQRIAEKLLDSGIDAFISAIFGKSGTSGGGLFGNLIGSFLGGFGGGGGGKAGSKLAGVSSFGSVGSSSAPLVSSGPAGIASLAAQGKNPTIVQVMVDEGALFTPRVASIAGTVSVQQVRRYDRLAPSSLADKQSRGLANA